MNRVSPDCILFRVLFVGLQETLYTMQSLMAFQLNLLAHMFLLVHILVPLLTTSNVCNETRPKHLVKRL